jgi:hypothetical protein
VLLLHDSSCRRITGALIGAGIPEYEAKRYEGRLTKGSILVSVDCDKPEEVAHAKEIMEHTGGDDISGLCRGAHACHKGINVAILICWTLLI